MAAKLDEDGILPYGFDPRFEAQLVLQACRNPGFMARCGHAVEVKCLWNPRGRLAMEAAQAIARENGRGPDSLLLVIQRLARWREQGKVRTEQIGEVDDYFEEAENAKDPPSPEQVIAEVVPILRQRLDQEAALLAQDVYSQRSDPGKVIDIYRRGQSLGVQDSALGVRLGEGSFTELDRVRHLERLSTGILELDDALSGGVPRGTFSVAIGRTKAGKSMFLVHQAANAMTAGLFVAVATLELSVAEWYARLIANLTGIPIDSIKDGAAERAREVLAPLTLGPVTIKDFPPHVTNPGHLKDWTDREEDAMGRPIDLLVIDYVGRMGLPPSKTANGRSSTYQDLGIITDELRQWSVTRKNWCWSAGQPKGGAGKPSGKKSQGASRLDTDDIADSQNIVRNSDLIVTLNGEQDIEYFVAGNRYGKSRVVVGPLPHDFSCAQMVPVNRLSAVPF